MYFLWFTQISKDGLPRLKYLKCKVYHRQYETVPHSHQIGQRRLLWKRAHHAENSPALAYSSTVLPTVLIRVRIISVRCLVDQRRQSTENLVQKLRIIRKKQMWNIQDCE